MNTEAALAHAGARDAAVSLLMQGKSEAEVWEALVSGGVAPAAAEALVRELLELRRQAEATDVSTPPIATIGNYGWAEADKGDYWKGFFAGLLCSCWALLAVAFLSHRTMGSETKRGIYVGFAVNVAVGVVYWMFSTIARGR